MNLRFIAIFFITVLFLPSFVVAGSSPTWKDGQAAKEQKDYKTAYKIFSKLAEEGDDTAQLSLSYFFEGDMGVKKDEKRKIYWLQKSAAQDNYMAQINLGSAFELGIGVNLDYEKAVYWYSKAANQGSEIAQYNVGLMYAKGAGVVQNFETAYFWLLLSSAKGNQSAIKLRDLIEPEIDFGARISIQKRASEWQPNEIWLVKRILKSQSAALLSKEVKDMDWSVEELLNSNEKGKQSIGLRRCAAILFYIDATNKANNHAQGMKEDSGSSVILQMATSYTKALIESMGATTAEEKDKIKSTLISDAKQYRLMKNEEGSKKVGIDSKACIGGINEVVIAR